ncbi:MAG: hypothetical protein JRJ46_15605 [Deltaproteobacteria bacterium]|nr:hypothetical protein [Deltaproteobacteria bacterium]
MRKIIKRSIAFFLITTLVFIPFATTAVAADQTQDDEIGAGAMTLDLLLVRPVGIIAVVFGTAVFIVSLPFSVLGGNSGNAAKKLVAAPASFTFKRKLGHFEELKHGGY